MAVVPGVFEDLEVVREVVAGAGLAVVAGADVDLVERIEHVPVFFGALPVGHGGTFSAPDGGEWASVSTRWLDWQLKANEDASRDFAGTGCRLCTDTRWRPSARMFRNAA